MTARPPASGGAAAPAPVIVAGGGFVPSTGIPPTTRAPREVEPLRKLMADLDGVAVE